MPFKSETKRPTDLAADFDRQEQVLAQAEAGFGLDFYLQYFKLSFQVKASFGFVNLHYPENNIYNRGIEGLYARNIFITVLFE